METQLQDALTLWPPITSPPSTGLENGHDGAYRLNPLLEADFLNPEEGDHFMQSDLHERDTTDAASIFRYIYRDHPTTRIFSDVKMLWGIKGLSQPAPDVAVVPNIQAQKKKRTSFDVQKEGTRPCFILEMVSSNYREADVKDKVSIYAEADVAEYVWIDPHEQEDGSTSYEVQGYTLQGNEYQPIEPNEQGWLYCATVNVWIGPNEAKDGFVIVDAKTRQRILPDQEARLKAEAEVDAEAQKRKEAEQRAANAEAELARLRKLLEQAGLG